ncbi:MAG: caspase family protein [Rhodospirillales bacterium]
MLSPLMRLLTFAAALSAGLALYTGAAGAQAPKRVALVIGNGAYKEGGALKNPVNDARAMAETLRQVGFHVIARENATKQQMERAVGEFGELLGAGSIALFYFAGHGMQVNGRNFLVPVDAAITSEARTRLEALDVDLVLDQMAASNSDVNLLVLDAGRNNPFERRFRGRAGGLAQINAPKGTLIAYATAPGTVAADGDGANGIYTAKLLGAIKTAGLPIEDVFKRVRVEVSRATNDAQTPWEASSLTGSFYFIEPAKVVAPPPGPSEADKEMLFWQSVKDTDDAVVLNAYLERYPSGTFAGLARAKIRSAETKLRQAALAPPPQPSAAAKEEAVWDLVKGSSDPDIIQAFLEKYPNGVNAEAARFKLATLKKPPPKPPTAAASVSAPAAPSQAPAAAKPAPPAGESEDALWARVGNAGDRAGLREYLERYPLGYYAATAKFRLEAMPEATSQIALAPAAAPAARPAAPGGVDGIWHGTYNCTLSQRSGGGPFSSRDRIFVVKAGRLSGRFEAQSISEQFQGTIAPGGKVVINGNGESMRMGRGYTIDMQGKEEAGRFTATGKHGDRDCTLVYTKVQ